MRALHAPLACAVLMWLAGSVQCLRAETDERAVWVDLSGQWRTIVGDDPRYADPQWDDTTWKTIRVPLPRGPGPLERGRFWLRRTVLLPQGTSPGELLALTTGALPLDSEVFMNGQRLAHPGSPTGVGVFMGRPRTFEFSSTGGRRVVVAIRVIPLRPGPGAWQMPDTGPWLLTSARAAPRREGFYALSVQKLSRTGDLAEALILLCLASLVLMIWVSQPDTRVLLWLGLYMAAVAIGRANLYLQIGPDAIAWPEFSRVVLLGLLPAVLLAHLVSVWTGQRWIAAPAWLLAGVGACSSLAFDVERWGRSLPYLLIGALVIIALGIHIWGHRKDIRLALGIVVVLYAHSASWGGIDLLGLPRIVQSEVGWTRFALVWHLISTTVFGFALTLVLLRRLLRDREEKVRLTGEFEAARTVQQLLLPGKHETSANFETRFIYEPAQETGGDFYWSRVAPDGALLVAIGDVSGKGLKAAMTVSVVVGILRNEKSTAPSGLLSALNEGLSGHTGGGFVTCCCARFDSDGTVTIANAGHPAPYSDGKEIGLEAGLPLGVACAIEYSESVLAGQRFTFVSDGVVEAANPKGELFGFDRTREISVRDAADIAGAAKAWGQNDDITVVTVFRRAA